MSSPSYTSRYASSKVSLPRVILSEWTKLVSLRSTVLSFLAAAVMIIGLGALITSAINSNWDEASPLEQALFDPTFVSLAGIFLAQLAVGVLGVLLFAGEYTTGMVRSTFAAVPRRLPVVWAKLTVFVLSSLVLMSIACWTAFFLGQYLLSDTGVAASWDDPNVVRAVFGAALYLTLIGVLGFALGALFRNVPGAVSVLFALLLILPILVNFLPSSWSEPVNKYLPSSAGQTLIQTIEVPGSLSPEVGFLVFVGYIAVALVATIVLLVRRDV